MREDQALWPDMPEPRNAAADRACVKITRGLIEEYINGLRRKQHPFDSRKTYRRALQLFCDSLPESMEVDGSTLLRWRKELLEKGYAARTINVSVSVVNSFLNWLGHREFQLTDRLELEESEPSDITRAEYLRLLRAAREEKRSLVSDKERRSRRPDRRHRCDSKAVSGGRSAGGAGNPRSLRRLYQNTSREIYCNLERLAEQAINTLLETEQLSIGWRVEGVNAPSEMS